MYEKNELLCSRKVALEKKTCIQTFKPKLLLVTE